VKFRQLGIVIKYWADFAPSADGSLEIRAYSFGVQAGWSYGAGNAANRRGMAEFLLP
jgi:hypothetical protein